MPTLALIQIRRENDLQARDQSHWTRDGAERTALDPAHVAALVEVLRSGRTFSTRPIVYQDEAGYWLADGWHRLAAYEVVGQTEIDVEIREGGRRGAFRHALGANAEHGKPRTQKDKRRAVDLALGDAEIGKLSNREIGDITGTSHTFVAGRRELRAAGEAMRQAAPRSRALGLAKARAALVCALNGCEVADVETFDLPGRPGQEVALWYDGIDELSREEIDEAIQALGDAHRAKTVPLYRQPPPRPDPLPGQQLLTGGEVPAVVPASERRAESRALGARIGRCIAALRAMDPHDLVHLGGDVGLVEARILLGSATSAPWAEIELATLEAALFPTVTPDRDDGPGSLVALESTCPQPATSSPSSPTEIPPAGDAGVSRMSPETATDGSATTATTGPMSPWESRPAMNATMATTMEPSKTESAPAGTTSPALTATTERPESWRAAITSALGLPVDEPLANVLRALARLQVRADQVPTLEADLAKAHERADKAETELAGRSPPAPMEALPDQQAWFVVHQRDGTPMVDPFIGEGAEHAAKLTARSYAARWTDVYVMVGCPVSSADFEAEAMAERARTAAVELHREPRWLATMRERLGAEPDEDVAWDAGRYVQATDVRRERERLGIPEYVAPVPPADPMAIYKPWRGAADELAVQLSALNDDELEQVRVAFNVTRGARLIERLTNRIRRGA